MKPGVVNFTSLSCLMPLADSVAPVWALIESGTEVRFSARRWAVTTMSPMPLLPESAAGAGALSAAGGGVSWAKLGVTKAKALVAKSNAEQVLVMTTPLTGQLYVKCRCCGVATETRFRLSSPQQRKTIESPAMRHFRHI